MEPKEYILARIDGDYAYLKRTDVPSEDELFIARALLPPDADEGSRLRYEMLEYTLI
ncbi:MAG: chorismate--pyruvate lyase [Clostridia bacterium]|nr:chorismate--pyruvate lyase [Clostridia bacterium]